MARNGAGTFSLLVNSWNPATNGNSATAVDWQALINDVASSITQSVSADGQTPITGNLQMGNNKLTGLSAGNATGNSLRWEQLFSQGTEVAIASAATTSIGVENSNFLQITGTTTITSLGTSYNGPRFVRFAGILTLTHNATTLILPTGANIVTAAGDCAIFIPKGNPSDGWNCVAYQKANGKALVESVATDYLNTTRIDVASATTVDLTANAPNTRNINITGTTTITGFTVAVGQTYFVRFADALTLTNNASIVTQTGANVVTTAGDTCIIRSTATDVVEVLSYVGPASAVQPGRVELSDATEFNTGTDTTRVPPVSVIRENLLVFGTPVTFTTQTAILSEAIPAWAREVHAYFVGLSTNGTSLPILQGVDSGGPETSGYLGAVSSISGAGSASVNNNTGFTLVESIAGATVVHGVVKLTRLDAGGTTWIASGTLGNSNAAATHVVGGSKILSARLTNVNLTTVGGANQFDNTGSGFVVFAWK